jgi:betaine-aldehyde dehydrogenase
MQFLTKLFINGEFVSSTSKMDVFNPATGKVLTQVDTASKEDVDHAVKSAHDALFGEWRDTTGEQRAVFLDSIAEELLARKEKIAKIETLNNGKTLKEALADVGDSAACFSYYAKLARQLDLKQGKPVDIEASDFNAKVFYEPIGVCAQIIPFNYPLLMASWKVAPALAAGCTLVLKPSEYTPLSALELAQIVHDIKLPKGVFNVTNGFGSQTGADLVAHPLVKKVAFTGSVASGKIVAKNSVGDLKSITLELGGKSPLVVLKDADLDLAVDWALSGIFGNKGEVCTATSRVLVDKSIEKEFMSKLSEHVKKIVVGDGMDEKSVMGPIVSKPQYEKVLGFIESAKKEGLTCVSGGKKPNKSDTTPEDGYFVEPTIFMAKSDSKVWKEEIFGPVLCVLPFSDEKEALHLANDTPFGLAAAVFTRDEKKFEHFCKRLIAGTVWHNTSQPVYYPVPFGGKKQSGIGRELGEDGLNNYLDPKTVIMNVSNGLSGYVPQ